VIANTTTQPPSKASIQSCKMQPRDSTATPMASAGQPSSLCNSGFFGLPVLMPSSYRHGGVIGAEPLSRCLTCLEWGGAAHPVILSRVAVIRRGWFWASVSREKPKPE
jgi:hypothetical protein